MLNESGFSEDIKCPYCGYEGAQYQSESRGEGRGETEYCYICGYYKYEPWDDYEEAEEEGYAPSLQEPDNAMVKWAKEFTIMFNQFIDILWNNDEEDYQEAVMSTIWNDFCPDSQKKAKHQNGHYFFWYFTPTFKLNLLATYF